MERPIHPVDSPIHPVDFPIHPQDRSIHPQDFSIHPQDFSIRLLTRLPQVFFFYYAWAQQRQSLFVIAPVLIEKRLIPKENSRPPCFNAL